MNIEQMEVEIQRLQATLDEIQNVCSEEYKETLDKVERLTRLLNEVKKVETEERKVDLNYCIEDEKNKEAKKRREAETALKVLVTVAAVGICVMTVYAEGTRVVTSKGVQMAARLLKV